jgi:hypothetical protein
MQMPRNKFDTHAACARMDADSTLHHRERWPSLAFVWDELDDLRAESQTAVDSKDHASVENELKEALDEIDEFDAITDQRDALSMAVKLLLEPWPDKDKIENILMGGGA